MCGLGGILPGGDQGLDCPFMKGSLLLSRHPLYIFHDPSK